MEARNHYETKYDANRIALLRLMIVLLSQPLFHSPDEYLVILNPFSTYLTNRRCKNVKNLFVSLVNYIISYDCAGYVSKLSRHADCLIVSLVSSDRESLTSVQLTRPETEKR